MELQICDFVAKAEVDWQNIATVGYVLVSHAEEILPQSDQDEEVHNAFYDTYLVINDWKRLSALDKEKRLDYLSGYIKEFNLWLKKRRECPPRAADRTHKNPLLSTRQDHYWASVSAWMSLVNECLPPNSKEVVINKLEDVAQKSRSLVGILEGHSFSEERLWQVEYFEKVLQKLSKEKKFPDFSYKTLNHRRRLSPLAKTSAPPIFHSEDKAIELD